MSAASLPFRIDSVASPDLGVRHLVVDRVSYAPVNAASVYEVHLYSSTDSHNTRVASLRPLLYLFSWALEHGINVEHSLLSGEGFSAREIQSFSAWLKKRWPSGSKGMAREHRRTYNAIVDGCRRANVWFTEQYALASENKLRRAIDLELLKRAHHSAWARVRIKVRGKPIAGDLTDNQIELIENFLKPENRTSRIGQAKACRDYLIWRLAIELGMRRGEVLALRTADCPSRKSPYFRIVRIEDRGEEFFDPRGDTAPRPKSLSRDLGFVMQNTRFPSLSSEYITAHRYSVVKSHGRSRRQFLLTHELLLVTESGEPISSSYMAALAKEIREALGFKFHWHLARHAFFNRAYAAVAEIQDRSEREVRLKDLIHWGGWADPSSIDIYVRHARQKRARNALMFWQEGQSSWKALD